jgi:PilZ domain
MTQSQFVWLMTGATFLTVVVISILALRVAGTVSRVLGQNGTGRPDRRGSERFEVSLPVFVYGHRLGAEPFHEDATVQQASADGGLLTLASNVQIGQELILTRNGDREPELHQPCRVARLGSSTGSKTEVAVQFPEPAPDFWSSNHHN